MSNREVPAPDRSSDTIRERLHSLKAAGRVRLDEEEIEGLVYALQDLPAFRISLFGSRVQPERRGGDIDILILTDAPPMATAQNVARRFFSRCEEKIDVVVMNPDQLQPEQADFLARLIPVEIVP